MRIRDNKAGDGVSPILPLALFVFFILGMLLLSVCAGAQEMKPVMQVARLTIDASRLEEYKAALQEEIETSMRIEPGVLSLNAVAEKDNPAHIIIFEQYADEAAYKAHLQSSHFIKYKKGTKDMVKSLELIKTESLFPELKKEN